MHHRSIDPVRGTGSVFGEKRRQLQRHCAQLDVSIARLDDEIAALSRQRREHASERRDLRRRLWPRLNKRGRQPAEFGSEALPPVVKNAVRLWGRRLRSVCLAILRCHGALALRDLHGELHRRGYKIIDANPVKALADAMRYETLRGRATRIMRGTYAADPDATKQRNEEPLNDPLHPEPQPMPAW